jgi:hypothetical protein
MIDRRTLLPRLAVLGGLAFSLPLWGQYSSPIRDVNDPGRTPFLFFSRTSPASGDGTPIVVASLPVGASQRLVVDFANISIQGADKIPTFVFITVSTSGVTAFEMSFPLIPLALPANGPQISIGLQPIRLYVSAGQTLTVTTLNLSSTQQSVDVAITGHYVTLP